MKILIKNVILDGSKKDVLIDNSIFSKIEDSISDIDVDDIIDATDKAIVPPFYNMHTHNAMSIMRGYADDLKLQTWLQDHIWPFEAKLTPHDLYVGAKLSAVEMIKGGSIFLNDMYKGSIPIAEASSEMGIRSNISEAFFDFGDDNIANDSKARLIKAVKDMDKIDNLSSIAIGPHAIYTVSRKSLLWVKDYAKDSGLKIHLHLSETEQEVKDSISESGLSPVRYLDKLGLLSGNLIAAHVVWVDDEEIKMLADRDVFAVHNPGSNMKLASGVFKYKEFTEAGVNFAIGTDSSSSNNNLSMLEEIKLASLKAKEFYRDPEIGSAKDLFLRSTSIPAKYVGISDGEIKVGSKADCLLINLNHILMSPGHDIISDLVYSANDSVVDYTICDGRVLMREGVVEGELEIIKEARSITKDILSRL